VPTSSTNRFSSQKLTPEIAAPARKDAAFRRLPWAAKPIVPATTSTT